MRRRASGGSEDPTATVKRGIDASTGGLLWVRRRNGSWWPGQILAPDEVTDSCVVFPRSGTPVKLLGRDDGSMDWYNLEKSKRIKAFRCGEYNQCIAIAKAKAIANVNKKMVKYARREDAIIHALELESAHLGRDHPDYFRRTNNSENVPRSLDKNRSIEKCDDFSNRDREIDSDTAAPEFSRSKRMRGLEGLGMGVGSKSKARFETVQLDSTTPFDSSTANIVSNGNLVNGHKDCLSFKMKRSQVANVREFSKKKNRRSRRQFIKVLESTAMVSVPVVCERLPVVFNNNSADRNGRSCENGIMLQASENACDSSDRLFDVPVIGEEKPSQGFSPILDSSRKHRNGVLRGQANQNGQLEAPSSKWLSKGKRKSRHRRKNTNQDSILNGFPLYNSISLREPLVRPQRSLPFRQSRFTVNSRYHSQEYLTRDVCTDSRLYDVRLDVKPNYRPHDVPSVTLVSKLNAKPIIGHPLTVEVLANGYCNQLMSNNIESDGKRYARKHNSIFKTRIPARRVRSKPRYSRRKAKLSKATVLSIKIRKLTSLTGQKQSDPEKITFPEKPNRPVTACVPVKLVFNRINVAVNGSTPQTQRKFSSILRSRILSAKLKHGFFNSGSKVEPAPL